MSNDEISDVRLAARNYFLGLVNDDFTQLGYLTSYMRKQLPDLASDILLDLTKSIVDELIDNEGLCVVDTKTEHQSDLSKLEIMQQIEMTFRLTAYKPDIGDGIWFGSRDYIKT